MSKRESKRRRNRRRKIYRQTMMAINITFVAVSALIVVLSLFYMFTNKKKYRNEGIELYNQGKYEEAIDRFDKALECKQWFSGSVNVDIELYKADCYLRIDRFMDAHNTYSDILEKYSKRHYDKEKVDFLISLTTTLYKYSNGDYVSTVANFVKAVDLGYTEMSIYVAICYENQRNYDKMKEYYDLYSKNFGMNTFMYYKYASYYIIMEDYNQALTNIEQGFNAGDQIYLRKLKYTQIMCYEKMKDYEYAFSLCKDFITLYPDDQNGADLYAYLDTRVNIGTNPVNDVFNVGTGSDTEE